jgi:hypothetical protein
MQSYTAFDLIDACKQPGCPVCRLEQDYARGYLNSLFHERVNDIDLRKTLRHSKGFCAEHGWLAVNENLAGPLGVALIYKDVINNTVNQLKKELTASVQQPKDYFGHFPNPVMKKAVRALTPTARCPACQRQEVMRGIIIASIVEKEGARKMLAALDGSDGLCFPHMKLVLQESRDPQVSKKLIDSHLKKYAAIRDDLGEIIRKQDYRFIDEAPGKEAGAWLRALEIGTGRMGNTKKNQMAD